MVFSTWFKSSFFDCSPPDDLGDEPDFLVKGSTFFGCSPPDDLGDDPKCLAKASMPESSFGVLLVLGLFGLGVGF